MWRGVLILVAAIVLMTAAPASSNTLCDGFVKAKGHKWTFQGVNVGCAFQRKWTKAFLRHGDEPKGWTCVRVKSQGRCKKKHTDDTVFVFGVRPGT